MRGSRVNCRLHFFCLFLWSSLWSVDLQKEEEVVYEEMRYTNERLMSGFLAAEPQSPHVAMHHRCWIGTSAVLVVVLVLERTLSRGWQLDVFAARLTVRSSSSVELGRDESSLASPRVRDTPLVISGVNYYCANRVVISSDAVMGCSSRSSFLTTLLLVVGLLSVALFAEISDATRKSGFIILKLFSRISSQYLLCKSIYEQFNHMFTSEN